MESPGPYCGGGRGGSLVILVSHFFNPFLHEILNEWGINWRKQTFTRSLTAISLETASLNFLSQWQLKNSANEFGK